MSRHGSHHTEERRPLAVVDTDTTDYYDSFGGLPPPHRLSGLYSTAAASNTSDSLHEHPYQAPAYASQQRFSGMADRCNQYGNGGHAAASGALPMSDSVQSFQSMPFNRGEEDMTPSKSVMGGSYSQEYAAPGAHTASYDHEAFLPYNDVHGSGRLSPAVAARERYMARKEAETSSYYAGAGAGAGGYGYAAGSQKRRCFQGKRKWAWIIGAVVLVAAIAGIAGGVYASRNSSSHEGVTGVVTSDSNDPSVFTKNDNLHQSFYGMCYTPLNAQYPACGDNLDAVIEDVQLMSQLTTRLRLYGADCDVPSLVLEAIQKTKVNMTVYLAAWVPQPADDPDNSTYERQVNAVIQAIKTYGVDNVDGITVGNEYLLNGGPEAQLLSKMADLRTQLAGMNLGKTIPVGTADAGSMVTTTLAQGSDYVMANVHAWFAGTTVDDAAGWVYSYTANQEPSTALQATNAPELFIAETGWPTGANETAMETYQGAVAGVPELNTFLNDYICQANSNITAGGDAANFSKYFFFEAFDEPWKDALYGGVEAHWGLFTSDKKLKDGLVLPNCSHP